MIRSRGRTPDRQSSGSAHTVQKPCSKQDLSSTQRWVQVLQKLFSICAAPVAFALIFVLTFRFITYIDPRLFGTESLASTGTQQYEADDMSEDDHTLGPRCFIEDGTEYCIPSIVGVCCVRAGSTALANYLNGHPYLSYGVRKEHQAFRFAPVSLGGNHQGQRSPQQSIRATFAEGPPAALIDQIKLQSQQMHQNRHHREFSLDTTTFYLHGGSPGQWGVAHHAFSSMASAAAESSEVDTTTKLNLGGVRKVSQLGAPIDRLSYARQFPYPMQGRGEVVHAAGDSLWAAKKKKKKKPPMANLRSFGPTSSSSSNRPPSPHSFVNLHPPIVGRRRRRDFEEDLSVSSPTQGGRSGGVVVENQTLGGTQVVVVEEEVLRFDFDPTYFGSMTSLASQGAMTSLLGADSLKLLFVFRDPAHQACAKIAGRGFKSAEEEKTVTKCWDAVGGLKATAVEGHGEEQGQAVGRDDNDNDHHKRALDSFVDGFERVRSSGVCGHNGQHPSSSSSPSATMASNWVENLHGFCYAEHLHHWLLLAFNSLSATPSPQMLDGLKRMHFVKSEELRDEKQRRHVVEDAVAFTGAQRRLNATLSWHREWKPRLEERRRQLEQLSKHRRKEQRKDEERKGSALERSPEEREKHEEEEGEEAEELAHVRRLLSEGEDLEEALAHFLEGLEVEHNSNPGALIKAATPRAPHNEKLSPKENSAQEEEEEEEEEEADAQARERLAAMRQYHAVMGERRDSARSEQAHGEEAQSMCEQAMRTPGGYLDTCNAWLAFMLQDEKWRWW